MIGSIDPVPEQPLLGKYMRLRREGLSLTQEEVAARMFISLSLYRKLESGDRPPSASRLEDWCRAVEAPPWMVRKLVSLALPNMATLARGAWPPVLTDTELELLELFPFPAYYHRFPEMEVVAANQAARAAFPWLDPTNSNSDRPVNLVEQMLTNETARAILINWEEIAHRMLYVLRLVAPGITPPDRLAQIIETCRTNPDFDRLWATDMSEEQYNRAVALVRDPVSGRRFAFSLRAYHTYLPDDNDYQLFLVMPRREPGFDYVLDPPPAATRSQE